MTAVTDQARATASPSFSTTHWSLVLAVRESPSPEAEAALASLCRTYWYPLFAFVRRYGYTEPDAQDLTQEFLAEFLEKEYFKRADPQRGRFRSFLLASMRNFLKLQARRSATKKRGGRMTSVALNQEDFHDLRQTREDLTPELLFDKRWAETVVDRVLSRLQREYASKKKAERFSLFSEFLWGSRNGSSYKELGRQSGMSVAAVKVAIYRFRERFRDLLRTEVAHTVADPDEVEDELRYLIKVLSASSSL